MGHSKVTCMPLESGAWQFVSEGHLGVGLSSFCVDVLGTCGLLAVAAYALSRWLRERRAAARADASFNPDVGLVPGRAIVLGTVEREQGANVAVRVELEMEGTEHESSGSWSFKWTEKDRRVRVHPFYLRHASGARIRVEPDDNVMLVDAMDGVVKVNLTKRLRVAELMPDEKVFAIGELKYAQDPEAQTRGYRGRAEGYLLVPPRRGRMLLASEPLGARFARRASSRAWTRGISPVS